ncbi:B3 domain-containing protein Os01g0723500-like [Papaver somniferum]|uniref:B3 domain-containing protein Os01g0723500-like n=1 Tax=Papaver somniferum TaxID=3469 RepID=UPI000E6F9928|nr:B3 domain-containing protein Os01g0723500-like [Papaver somniferum]
MGNKIVEPGAERRHHIFKIFHEEEQNRRLRIPVAFCSRLPTDSPACKWAIIQGLSGASCVVEVNKTENGTFLEDGWEIFLQENCLKKYDFLVFRHDGGMQFLVKVFKGKGCPREECFAPALSPILAQESHGPPEECITPVVSPLGRELVIVGDLLYFA